MVAVCDHRKCITCTAGKIQPSAAEPAAVFPKRTNFLRECRREQKPVYLYHSAGPCKSLFPIRGILPAERFARHDALHDLRRAVADFQPYYVAPALLQRRVHVVAVMAMQDDAGMDRLSRDLRP